MLLRLFFVIGLLLSVTVNGWCQARFSLSTGLSVYRSFTEQQQFTSLGQSVQTQMHLNPKHGPYAAISYYVRGRFSNNFVATAKQPATTPASRNFRVDANWRIAEFSLGWRTYLLGNFSNTQYLNVFARGGFGILFIRAENKTPALPDTALYTLPPNPQLGTSTLRRLTLDAAVGAERSLSGNLFVFGELSTAILLSDTPSPLRHTDAPFPRGLALTAGIRILFGD
jgi:hypothetical protein